MTTTNPIEFLESFVDLLPNTKDVTIKTTKEDVEKFKEAINSEFSESNSFSFGNFDNKSIPADFYGLNYRGVNFFFSY